MMPELSLPRFPPADATPQVAECPVLSVVVIGRNEGIRLSRCLESIERMLPLQGSIEVIYVDSDSTDGSLERAEQFKVKAIGLDSANPCAAAGRNAGWRTAKAPIVLFLDGDTLLEPSFVASSIEEFRDPRVAVVFGNRERLGPDHQFIIACSILSGLHPPAQPNSAAAMLSFAAKCLNALTASTRD